MFNFLSKGMSLISIVIIVVAVVLLGGGLYFYFQKQIPETPTGLQEREDELIVDEQKGKEFHVGEEEEEGEGEKEEGLKILHNHNTYTDYLDYFHVVGEIQNLELKNVKSGTVKVTFIDEEGRTVLTGSGPIMIDIITPGKEAPFHIVFPQKPSFTTYILQVTEWETTEEISYTDIKIENQFLQEHDEGNEWYELRGDVKNIGNKNMTQAYILVTFYDNSGKVIDIQFAFSENESLKEGETSSFSVGIRLETYNKMKNYVIYTEGYLKK